MHAWRSPLRPPAGKAHVGVVTVQMKSAVNMDDHTVFLSNPQVTSISFPSLDPATTAADGPADEDVPESVGDDDDFPRRLTASVKKERRRRVAQVNNDPPTIFISLRPADPASGEWHAGHGADRRSNLQFIVNANWPLFPEQWSSTYYLFDGKGWLTLPACKAPGLRPPSCRSRCRKVPQNPNFADLKASFRRRRAVPPPPTVYYSATPAEIVVFRASPQWTPFPARNCRTASNTDSPVFKYAPTGRLLLT